MNFEGLTLAELKDMAKEKGVKNISKLKKEELITVLSEEKVSESSNDSERYKVTNEDDSIVEGIL